MTLDTFNVNGMKCQNCAGHVEKAIQSLAGVNQVSVDLARKTVTVKYDASRTSLKNIVDAIEDQGYEVVPS